MQSNQQWGEMHAPEKEKHHHDKQDSRLDGLASVCGALWRHRYGFCTDLCPAIPASNCNRGEHAATPPSLPLRMAPQPSGSCPHLVAIPGDGWIGSRYRAADFSLWRRCDMPALVHG